jgi:nucleotide-binding universal stress UspA family protein
LAPSEAPENLAPTVAIAWKETAEAARAVGAAMPLLRKADRVFVLAGDEGDALAEGMESAVRLVGHLRRHGISAQPKAVLAAGRTLPEAILETAGELRSNLLVSGAYGHSRARELVFGGFTRHIIKEARLPVFLFH